MKDRAEANVEAQQFLAQHNTLNQFDIRPANPHVPFRLWNGWRFVWEVYLNGLRVRGWMIILFVGDYDEDTYLELNPLSDLKKRTEIAKVLDWINLSPYKVPIDTALHNWRTQETTAVELVRRQLNAKHINTTELTIKPYATNHEYVVWRIEYIDNQDQICVASVPCTYHEIFSIGNPTVDKFFTLRHASPLFNDKADRWTLGQANMTKNRKWINFHFDPEAELVSTPDLARHRSSVTISHCQFHLHKFLVAIGFINDDIVWTVPAYYDEEDISLHGRHPTTGAHVALMLNLPFIMFKLVIENENCYTWGDDPTIVLHEYGHVLKYIYFVYWTDYNGHPHQLRVNQNNEALSGAEIAQEEKFQNGIDEGWCDYLAAAVIHQANDGADKGFSIGGYVDFLAEGRPSLPRTVNSLTSVFPNGFSPNKEYDIAEFWANILWDYRQMRDNPVLADRVVLKAHLQTKPLDPDKRFFDTFFWDNLVQFDRGFTRWGELAQKIKHLYPDFEMR